VTTGEEFSADAEVEDLEQLDPVLLKHLETTDPEALKPLTKKLLGEAESLIEGEA
jgi:hypothetical protein